MYALLENDMRRILAYSIVNQIGFMVCGVGVGTPLAIAGVVAHAFCHIIYKALLWMSIGAVLHRTGKSKCTELGGLYKSMPITTMMTIIGALSISAVPLTCGFISKTSSLPPRNNSTTFGHGSHLRWPQPGCSSTPAFRSTLFSTSIAELRPKEAPRAMITGMALMAFLCIYLGLNPGHLYGILPHGEVLAEKASFYYTYIKSFDKVVTVLQMLLFSALMFFILLPLLKRTSTISIDFDWFYRKGAKLFYDAMDKTFNSLNKAAERLVIKTLLPAIAQFVIVAPATLTVMLLRPVWRESLDADEKSLKKREEELIARFSSGTFPVAYSAIFVLIFIGLLVLLGRVPAKPSAWPSAATLALAFSSARIESPGRRTSITLQ